MLTNRIQFMLLNISGCYTGDHLSILIWNKIVIMSYLQD